MAVTSPDDQVPTPRSKTCASKQEDGESPCPGRKADGFEHCLAHLESAELDQVLQRLKPGADLDASGTPIDADLLAQILRAVGDEDGRPVFGRVSFAGARFGGAAVFAGAQFSDPAAFGGAKFSEVTVFGGAKFSEGARFATAQFSEGVSFNKTQFSGTADFADAQFSRIADFADAQFSGLAVFRDAQFRGIAAFRGAQFRGTAAFRGAQFSGTANFRAAQFGEDVGFYLAQFTGDAHFDRSRFQQNTSIGPLTARLLDLTEAVFDRHVVIEAAAAKIKCRGTTWNAGVTFRLRYAAIDLERATFTQPSFVTGSDEWPWVSPVKGSQVHGHVLTRRADSQDTQAHSPDAWMPSLETLRGVDAANLSVTDVDLSCCSFAGALLLDQLRLEGRCVFDNPPTGIRAGRAWPPVWRWSRRQNLWEERNWRATTPKYLGWSDTRLKAAEVGPDRLAALYRQLRKAQEDAKNEPGAADFYYGEMEMRRHARSTPWAERFILAAYWAVSGYGLRATRAFAALAILIAGSAVVLQYAGFPGHTAAYLDSLLYAAGSVLSLSLVIGHLPVVLTHWGDVIRMLLRIAGPVLLGLAALALRGRVKR